MVNENEVFTSGIRNCEGVGSKEFKVHQNELLKSTEANFQSAKHLVNIKFYR